MGADTSVKRGAKVAQDLGWPEEELGALAALGGLIDPAALEYERPRSALLRIEKSQRRAQAQITQRGQQTLLRILTRTLSR